MRLTQEIKVRGHKTYRFSNGKKASQGLTKLGKLEDIEELCEKVRKNKKIYFVDIFGKIQKENIEDAFVGYDTKYDVIIIKHGGISPDSYGKTWALTKGELE